jgi:hypothetical protein
MEGLLWGTLAWVLFPLWLASGVADYAVHRRTSIATTSGVHESHLHLLQTAEIALPALVLLFLEINALTILLIALGVAAHTVTAWRDLRYASRLRKILPFEQFAHAFLITLPLFALAIIAILHWAQLDDWRLAWRSPSFEPWVIAAVLAASFVFGVLPGLAEYRATRKAAPR